MKLNRESRVQSRGPEGGDIALRCPRPRSGGWHVAAERGADGTARRPCLGARSAFTLIEIMVAVGIIAIILTIAMPTLYQQMHKDSMRQAVKDITEACGAARSRAILNGVATELRIRPNQHLITVVEGSSRSTLPGGGASSYTFEGDEIVEHRPANAGGGVFSATLSDHIIIEFIGVNLIPDLQQLDEVSCMFYPNGTSDELVVLIRSDQGEIRKITTDVVTGIADVEVVK